MRKRDARGILSYGRTEERGSRPRTRGRRGYCVLFHLEVDVQAYLRQDGFPKAGVEAEQQELGR